MAVKLGANFEEIKAPTITVLALTGLRRIGVMRLFPSRSGFHSSFHSGTGGRHRIPAEVRQGRPILAILDW